VAGVLLAVPFIGLTGAYYLMGFCFLMTALILSRVPGGEPSAERAHEHPYRELVDGLRYIRNHDVLPILILMGFVPIVIGMPYRSFLPVYQEDVYGVGEVWLGIMGATAAVGALIGSLAVASLTATAKRSLIQLVGSLGFGVTLIVFAAAPALPLGLLALLFVGLTSNGFWALNNTMVLGNASPQYYGRVMSVYMLSWSFNSFAALPEGRLADAIGVQTMTAGVGVVLIISLLLIITLPSYRRLRAHELGQIEAAAG
jgi:predicted MFS family arabinose efflux permease